MVDLLTTLKRTSESEPGRIARMFQTHPVTSKRIEQAQEHLRSGEQYRRFSPKAPGSGTGRYREMRALMIRTLGRRR